MYEYVQCTKCGRKLDTGLSCPNGCNKEQNFNSQLVEDEKFTSTNTGSPKLFLLQVQDVIECNECSDADKVAGVKLLVAEQLRAGA